MITLREAEVAAGNAVQGSVAGAEADMAWLIWRLEVVNGNFIGEGGKVVAGQA
jgi:hypothetical protein